MRITKVLTIAILLALGLSAQGEKQWKANEFPLYEAVTKAADPAAQVAALNQWKEKVPDSDYRDLRLRLYIKAYEQLKDVHKIVEVLGDLATLNPTDVAFPRAIAVMILSPGYNDVTPPTLATGEKAAKAMLGAPNPPKTDLDLSHRMLAWVAANRKDYKAAEAEYRECLKIDPNLPDIDYWLAVALHAQKTNISEALFYYARAAMVETGNTSPAFRQSADSMLRKLYKSYHGKEDAALDELKKTAAAEPFPPAGFHIMSEAEVLQDESDKFQKAYPDRALWQNLKSQLTSPEGAQYFDANMKGADVPGGAGGVQGFKATVISSKPALRPKELVVAISDPKTPEAVLKLDAPLTVKVEAGAQVEFDGVPEAFTASPFMLTFSVEKAKLKVSKP